MAEARAALERALAENRPVYGLTTGLGARLGEAVAPERAAEQSARIVRGRAAAVGEPLPAEAVRAAILARLNGLCAGGSGASPAVAETLAGMLNAGVHPVVPRSGSIGSGDLCLLAHVGLVVMGEGEADLGGERLAGADALRRAGVAPVKLGPGDGLALCSSPAVAAGVAALALETADGLLETLGIAAALSMEGFRASPWPIDGERRRCPPGPGPGVGGGGPARAAARRLAPRRPRPAAAGSAQLPLREPRPRGAALGTRPARDRRRRDAQRRRREPARARRAATSSRPGNFHTPALALALDTCAIAVSPRRPPRRRSARPGSPPSG